MVVGNPVFVHFNEPADALQQLLLVKVLGGSHRSQGSRFAQSPSTLSPSRADWPLTGKQRRLAERSILSMLSHGRKRRTCWSLPLYAFRPSKSCGDRQGRGAQGCVQIARVQIAVSRQHPDSKRHRDKWRQRNKGVETSESTGRTAMEAKPFNSTMQEEHHRRSTTGGAPPLSVKVSLGEPGPQGKVSKSPHAGK